MRVGQITCFLDNLFQTRIKYLNHCTTDIVIWTPSARWVSRNHQPWLLVLCRSCNIFVQDRSVDTKCILSILELITFFDSSQMFYFHIFQNNIFLWYVRHLKNNQNFLFCFRCQNWRSLCRPYIYPHFLYQNTFNFDIWVIILIYQNQ